MKKSTQMLLSIMVAAMTAAIITAFVYSTPNEVQSSEETLLIFTTFYPIHEFTKNVAGDKAAVENLIPFNVEPHDYEFKPKTLISLKNADLLIYNGASFEPFVKQIASSGEFSKLVFVETTRGIDLLDAKHEEEHEEDHHEESFTKDPHVWLDPILAKHQVNVIADALAKNDPANADYYYSNALSYSDKLDALDTKIRSDLSSCKKDTFVPFHNAFTYFAERYDLKIKPLVGLSPEANPSAKEIEEFIKFAKENDIKYFFTEEMVDTRLSEQLAKEVGGGILTFSPLEGLSSEDQKRQATYFDKMEDNLKNLKIALECS